MKWVHTSHQLLCLTDVHKAHGYVSLWFVIHRLEISLVQKLLEENISALTASPCVVYNNIQPVFTKVWQTYADLTFTVRSQVWSSRKYCWLSLWVDLWIEARSVMNRIPPCISGKLPPGSVVINQRYVTEVSDLESWAHYCGRVALHPVSTGAEQWAVQRWWSIAGQTAGEQNISNFIRLNSLNIDVLPKVGGSPTLPLFVGKGTWLHCLEGKQQIVLMVDEEKSSDKWQYNEL